MICYFILHPLQSKFNMTSNSLEFWICVVYYRSRDVDDLQIVRSTKR